MDIDQVKKDLNASLSTNAQNSTVSIYRRCISSLSL